MTGDDDKKNLPEERRPETAGRGVAVVPEQPPLRLAHAADDYTPKIPNKIVGNDTSLSRFAEERMRRTIGNNGSICDAETDINHHLISDVAGGAESMSAVCDVAVATARAKGYGDDPDKVRDEVIGYAEAIADAKLAEDLDRVPPPRIFETDDYAAMASYVLLDAPGLEFGVYSKTFYNCATRIPTTLVEGMIQEQLMLPHIAIEDPMRKDDLGRRYRVKPSNHMIREVRDHIARRRAVRDVDPAMRRGEGVVIDMNPALPSAPAPRLTGDTGMRFDDVLVLDAGAWTGSDEIKQAVDPMWREWCERTGTGVDDIKAMFILLNKWAGDAIKRHQRSVHGSRVWGYAGLRVGQK